MTPEAEQQRRKLWRLLLAAFTLLIIHASLYPWDLGSRPIPAKAFSISSGLNRFILRDAVSNLLFYAPFGVAFVLAAGRRTLGIVFAAVAASALLSGALETIQTTQLTRSSNALDFVCNVAGAGVAAWGTRLYRDRLGRAALGARPHGIPAAWAVLALWLCFKFYPGLPVLSRTRLLERVTAAALVPLSPWDVAAFAAEWIAVARLLELGVGPAMGCATVVAAVLIVPMRLLFDGPV
ncbi:MAG TPA: VanZ family protein, partial [Bryobacteraceae bacterium]|nr:VanZ family protein [Bryobacteraceae bacterium]